MTEITREGDMMLEVMSILINDRDYQRRRYDVRSNEYGCRRKVKV